MNTLTAACLLTPLPLHLLVLVFHAALPRRTPTNPTPAAELLGLLEPPDGSRAPRDWPKDGRALTAVLRRRGPALRRLGWTVDDLGRGGKARVVRFRIAPPGDTWQAGDEAGDRQATTPARQATAAGVACLSASPRPAETPETDRQAGDAGDKHGPPLLEALKEVRERAAIREGAETSPATPATPALPASGPEHGWWPAVVACAVCAQPVRPSRRAIDLGLETICSGCDTERAAS